MAPPVPVPVLAGEGCGLAVARGPATVDLHRDAGRLAAVHGSPRFADPALVDIAGDRGPAAALAAGIDRLGPAILGGLHGAFAVAWIDGRSGEALLAIDRVGGRCPLVYFQRGETLLFGSSGAALDAHPAASGEVDLQGLYNFIYFYMVPGPGTARRDVRRLLPGTYLHLKNGDAGVVRYHETRFEERGSKRLADLEEEFHAVLRQSVADDFQADTTACFLSGGTDSSAVAGVAAALSDRRSPSYSIGFEAGGYDEMSYARIAARRFGIDHREYYVTPADVADLIPRLAAAYGDPFGNESAVPTYYCAKRAAEDGSRRMLAGDGGDELFAGNERYAIQHVFGIYGRVPAALRSVFEPVLFSIPAGERIAPIRRARNYVRSASSPMPQRMQAYNYLERLGRQRILEPAFLEQVDPGQPLRLLGEAYAGARADSMLNRMLAMDCRFTLADNDLQKVSRMGELAGVDVRYPLLSDSMVDFASRLPPNLKLRHLKLRWFWKHALRDFLPREVLTKKKHGFGLPFGVWLREDTRLRELAGDSLAGLKARRIIRPAFIDELTGLHRQDHAAYYGVIIWVLMMLEQWFRHHRDRG